MWLSLFFVAKNLLFLLCGGVEYLTSNFDNTLTILETKTWSFLSTFTGWLVSFPVQGKAGLDVIEATTGLDTLQRKGVEVRIDSSMESEASDITSTEGKQ